MAYIFLDESGDLGFDWSKKKTSRFFVIALLFAEKRRPIEKIIKKIYSELPPRQKRAHTGVFHCFHEKPAVRKRVLRTLAEKDVSIVSIYLNKSRVYTKLQDEKHVLYNYVTNILLDRVCTKKLIPIDQPVTLVASRRETNRYLNENFKQYLENQIAGNHQIDLKISIRTPAQDKCLQVVDFVCWSIFRNREHRDDSYYNLIKSRIVEENPLFP